MLVTPSTPSARSVALFAACAALLAGCSDKVIGKDYPESAGSGGSDTGTSTASGTTSYPSYPCTPKAPACHPGLSDCVALVDNAGKETFGLRMSQIVMTKPEVLSKGLVGSILAKGLTMNLSECMLSGDGTFSWLLELSTAPVPTLKTGGAFPAADPAAGYCFVNQSLDGHTVTPVTVELASTTGAFSSTGKADVFMPIFLDQAGTSAFGLPLEELRFVDVTPSEGNNCIGSFNDELLDPLNNCQGDSMTPAFESAGQLEAFITVEGADGVVIEQLQQSLCVLLSSDPGVYGDGKSPERCKRYPSGNIVLQGDWCAATNSAATPSCSDAFRLEAAFAASAVDITGDCP